MSGKNEITSHTASELMGFIYDPAEGKIAKPFTKNIRLMETPVAGTTHIKSFKRFVKGVEVGDRVLLLREPKNKYDDLAILVKTQNKHKLGYIPRRNNQVIASLMDAGKYLYGVVVEKNDELVDDEPWDVLRIEVYMED